MSNIFDVVKKEELSQQMPSVSKHWTGETNIKPTRQEVSNNRLLQDEEMGWFMTTMDYLARGNYALANITMDALKGKLEPGENLGGRFYQSAKEGFTAKKRTTFVDVMEELIPGRHPWIEIPVGFVGDVVVDPINLVPMAWFGKVGRLLKLPQLLKAADEVSGATKAMKKAGMILSDLPPIDKLGKAFKPGWKLRKIPEAYKTYRDLQLKLQFLRKNVLDELKVNWDEFRKVSKKLGKNPNVEAAKLIDLREAGKSGEVLEEFKPFYESVVKGLDELGKEEKKAGILKNTVEDYFPHILEKGQVVKDPKSGRIFVKKQKGFYTKLAARQNQFYTKAKKFKTIEDLKLQLLKWREIDGFASEIAPVDNWFRGYAIRRFVGESALAWKSFIDDALKKFGTPFNDVIEKEMGMSIDFMKSLKEEEMIQLFPKFVSIQKGNSFITATANLKSPVMKELFGKQLKEALQKSPKSYEKAISKLELLAEDKNIPDMLFNVFKKTKGKGVVNLDIKDILQMEGKGVYLFPSEFAKEIKDTFKVFSTDESSRAFADILNRSLHIWKTMATSMRLPFHVRNALSNTWLMYLGGVDAPLIPKRMIDAALVQLGKKGFNGFSPEELLKLFDRFGVRAYGWVGADIPTMFQKELGYIEKRGKLARTLGAGENIWNPFETAARAGRKVGTHIEDNARMAVMLDQMKKRGIYKTSKPEFALANKIDGKIVLGKKGEIHADISNRIGKFTNTITGYVDKKGVFYTKKEAMTALRKGTEKDTLLHGHYAWADQLESKYYKSMYNKLESKKYLKEFSEMADHVKKFMFDYTELTEFERRYMKKIFPFYTWLRKNIPLQLEQLVKQPHKYARLGDFERDLFPLFTGRAEQTPMEKQIMPQWMKEAQYRKTSWTASDGSPIYFKLDLPSEDLYKMGKLKTWLSALNPLYTLTNIAANVRHWPSGGKLSEPGQLSRAPWYIQFLSEKNWKLMGIQPMRSKNGSIVMGMNPQWKYALQTAFPFLNDWEKAYPGMGELSVRDEKERKWALLSYATGIKFKPLSKEDAALNTYFMMQKIKRDVRRAVKQRPSFDAKDLFKIIKGNLEGK